MKKLSKWIAFFTVAIGLLVTSFSSCSNLVDDATIDGGSTSISAKSITITASSQDDIVKFGNGASRMIMPGQLDATTGYKFWLVGENKTTGAAVAIKSVEFQAASGDTTKGTVTLDLDIAQYELRLYVVPTSETPANEDAAKSKAVLSATATVDFTHSDTVNFYLTPYSLSANGAFDLTLYLDGWELAADYTSKAGVYPLTSMETSAAKKEASFYPNADPTNTPKWTNTAPAAANFTSGDGYTIEPGTYNFVVTFTSPAGKSYCYNDKIVILSNRRTEKTIAIPNVIEVPPAAPSAFGVSFAEPLSADDDSYEVQFEWTDNAYNETNFKLELIDFTKVTSVAEFEGFVKTLSAATGNNSDALDSAWTSFTTSSTNYSSKEVQYNFTKSIKKMTPGAASEETIADSFYYAPEWWVDGSCFLNSSTATIRLPLEHRFLARICAQNEAGDSKYVYVDLSGTTVTAKTGYKRNGVTAVAPASLSKFGADASSINRFRIRYYLNGGKFQATAAPTTAEIPVPTGTTARDWEDITDKVTGISPTKDAVVVYGTQRNLATSANITNILNPLLAATSETGKFGVLYQETNRWTGWLVGSVSGTTYTGTTDYNKPASTAPYYSQTDPTPINPKPVVYKDWDSDASSGAGAISTKNLALGSTNIDLYATYRITSGNWYTDESAEYAIQDNWVKLYSSPTSITTLPGTATEAAAANKANGVFVYTKSGTATGTTTAAPNAYFLYAMLLNDGTNNKTKAGNGITYDKVAFDILYRGTTSKAAYVSSKTAEVSYDLGGGSATANTMSYVEIPLQSLPTGKYQIMIYAYANTQQKLYTYPIWVDIRDGGAATPVFTATSKTFAFADIASATIADISSATSGDTSVVTANAAGGTVTLTSVAAGTTTVTLTDSSSATQDISVTVDATGAISATGVTLH